MMVIHQRKNATASTTTASICHWRFFLLIGVIAVVQASSSSSSSIRKDAAPPRPFSRFFSSSDPVEEQTNEPADNQETNADDQGGDHVRFPSFFSKSSKTKKDGAKEEPVPAVTKKEVGAKEQEPLPAETSKRSKRGRPAPKKKSSLENTTGTTATSTNPVEEPSSSSENDNKTNAESSPDKTKQEEPSATTVNHTQDTQTEPTPPTSPTNAETPILEPSPQKSASEQQQLQLQQQQQTPLLILGQPGGPGGPQLQRQQQISASNTIIASSIATLLTTIVRLWFLTSLTKWWAEEDSVKPSQHFMWERLNDRYCKDATALSNALSEPPPDIHKRKWRRMLRKQKSQLKIANKIRKVTQQNKNDNSHANDPSSDSPLQEVRLAAAHTAVFDCTVLVVEIKPKDSGNMDLKHLKAVVTFLLTQHRNHAFGSTTNGGHDSMISPKKLEVVLLVESPGGSVTEFGLAAAEVGRLSNEKGITTTVCVDDVAASGGYMIASQAHTLCAAPFAIVGSIGVFRESINVHKALKKQGIQGLVIKAGDSKAPLGMLGPVTKRDVETAQRSVDKMHKAFQKSVVDARPVLADSLNDVCNGDIYLGTEAKDLSLVDRVVTSEEYILERITAGDRVLKLHRSHEARMGRIRLSPLDFIRHKSSAMLRSVWDSMATSEGGSGDALSRMLHAGSFVGFVQYLVRHRP